MSDDTIDIQSSAMFVGFFWSGLNSFTPAEIAETTVDSSNGISGNSAMPTYSIAGPNMYAAKELA
ncbi:hypothetical protein, partial [Vibrio parahaemolyticus]|uniref:hypothetical protein n=1 Tax=Vibrio parahaemolyticus TaxID=670 RepID=UPI00146F8747